MKSLGAPEILIIALVILLLFGAKKLPELAKGLGEGIKNFKNILSDLLGNLGAFGGKVDSRALLSANARAKIPPEVLHKISEAMAHSVATTFKWTLIPITLGFIAIILMGKEKLTFEVKENRAKKAQ